MPPEAVEPAADDQVAPLNDEERAVREWAALVLAYVGSASASDVEPAVPKLLELLSDEHGSVRKNASLALLAAGAQSTLPALRDPKDDQDPAVRRVVLSVLGER